MKNRIIAIIIIVLLLGFGLIFNELTSKGEIKSNSAVEWNDTITITQEQTTTLKKTAKKKAKKKTKKKKTTKKKSTKKKSKRCYSLNVKGSKSEIKEYARQQVIARWGEGEWNAFDNIVQRESGWNANSVNRSSCACGLFQLYPCSKGGASYRKSYQVQVQKGIDYISYRYGTPSKAWKFWQKHHWY